MFCIWHCCVVYEPTCKTLVALLYERIRIQKLNYKDDLGETRCNGEEYMRVTRPLIVFSMSREGLESSLPHVRHNALKRACLVEIALSGSGPFYFYSY